MVQLLKRPSLFYLWQMQVQAKQSASQPVFQISFSFYELIVNICTGLFNSVGNRSSWFVVLSHKDCVELFSFD